MPHNTQIDFQDEGQVKQYLDLLDETKKPLRHENYYYTKDQAFEMAVHIEGLKPAELLEEYRPNEPIDIHNYRLKIWEPITKSWAKKIINVAKKIKMSGNWKTDHPKEIDTSIPEGETLEDYADNNYPQFGSIENWVFNVTLKQDFIDANALCVFMPLDVEIEETDFFQPFGKIYRSDQVYDYDDGNYYTILLDEKSLIKDKYDGNIYLVVTKNEIIKITQVGRDGSKNVYEQETVYTHNFDDTPAFFLGGDYATNSFPFVFDSFIYDVVPFWNKAVRQESDLDAQYVQHMYLERVEIEVDCDNNCYYDDNEGYNVVAVRDGECVMCKRCQGTGKIKGRSPHGVTQVKKDELGTENTQIFPGVEYIDKPIDIVTKAEERVDSLITKGLATLNMEFLSQIPLTQSGEAKKVDREEVSAWLSDVSDNLFDNILYNSYYYINLWRYFMLFNGSQERLEANLPTIHKPINFNIITDEIIAQQMNSFKNSGVSDETLSILESDLIDKRFSSDVDKRKILKTILELDPMPNKSEQDKMTILANRGTTQLNYIISSNMKPFVLRAISEDEGFLSKPREEQLDILKSFGEELMPQQAIPLTNPDGSTGEDTGQ